MDRERERERDIVVRIMVIIAVFSPLWPTLLMILMEEWKLEREREGGLFYVLCHTFSGLELKLRETLRNRNERNKL